MQIGEFAHDESLKGGKSVANHNLHKDLSTLALIFTQSRFALLPTIQAHPLSTIMAPPTFPNNMTLYTIGFAALKYPALPPPPVNVPLGNQLGVIQHQPQAAQNQAVAQIASQYLDALLEYQTSDDATLRDPSSPQYYFSTAICLLNLLSFNPDVCKRIARHPTIVNSIIEKLLVPDFESSMKGVPRPGGTHFPAATFDAEFGGLLQFLSTMLLYTDEIETLHPRIKELIPKLRTWKKTYRNSSVRTIKDVAERLVDQIQGMDPTMISMMRSMQENQSLACGVSSCSVKGARDLTVCGVCRVQRYCGREHQKMDWKYHKHICNKGLQEPAAAASQAATET